MKQFSLALNTILVIAVAVLFYLHFKKDTTSAKPAATSSGAANGNFKIAYFDLDSLQNQYNYYKDVIDEVQTKEKSIRSTLMAKRNGIAEKYKHYQSMGKSMTQEQMAQASNELGQMDKDLQLEEQTEGSKLSQETREKLLDVKGKIEAYLKEFNASKQYAFIVSNTMTNEILYYKDSTLNITKDLVKGLNDLYKKEKKKN